MNEIPIRSSLFTGKMTFLDFLLTLCLLYRQVLLYLYAQHQTLKYKSIDKFLFRQNQVVLDFRVELWLEKGLALYLPIS